MANGIYNILNVENVDKSREFYKALGFKTAIEEMPMGPDTMMRWATVHAGKDHSMMIMARNFPGADPEDVAWASGEVGKGILVNVGVPNATKTFENAKRLGVTRGVQLESNPWGGKGFMIADPDGYYLMITDKFPGPAPKAKKSAAKTAKKAKGKPKRR